MIVSREGSGVCFFLLGIVRFTPFVSRVYKLPAGFVPASLGRLSSQLSFELPLYHLWDGFIAVLKPCFLLRVR